MDIPSLNVESELLDSYCIAYDQAEGDLGILAMLVMFVSTGLNFIEIRRNLDAGNVDDYLEYFDRIGKMNPAEIATFLKCYNKTADRYMSGLCSEIADQYKKNRPKAKIKNEKKKIVVDRSLF